MGSLERHALWFCPHYNPWLIFILYIFYSQNKFEIFDKKMRWPCILWAFGWWSSLPQIQAYRRRRKSSIGIKRSLAFWASSDDLKSKIWISCVTGSSRIRWNIFWVSGQNKAFQLLEYLRFFFLNVAIYLPSKHQKLCFHVVFLWI